MDKNREEISFSDIVKELLVEEKNKNVIPLINIKKAPHYKVKVKEKKENIIKYLISIVSYTILNFLIIIGILLFSYMCDIKIKEIKGDYSNPKYNAYVVLSGSMIPEINVNDIVITKEANNNDLNIGDIITYTSTDNRFLGMTITHRIINKTCINQVCKYKTKGDNNSISDKELVELNNIYGKVILKIPKLGYAQTFLARNGILLLIILIPCQIIMSYDIYKIFKKIFIKITNSKN